MTTLYEINNNANWLQVYSEHREVVRLPGGSYQIFPPFAIPFLFDKSLLAVKALSDAAKPHWKFAGTLTQQVQIGSGGGTSPLPLCENQRRSLRLGRTELCKFPMLTPSYSLLLEVPYWIEDLLVQIWEYVGTETDSVEQSLEGVRIDVLRVEAKVDYLAAK